jgi:hypothetical protein
MQIRLHPPEERGRCLERSVIETYPGAVATRIGFVGNYKQTPECCLEAAERYLREQDITLDFNKEVRASCVGYRTLQMIQTRPMRFFAS